MAKGDRGHRGVTGAKPRTVPRNHRLFTELRNSPLTCVVISRDNDYRPIEKDPADAWDMLDRDPKAKLLDLGDGTYKVERRPWPMHYELTTIGDDQP